MARKIFRSAVCTFSQELRQRQIIRGLGLTAIASLVIAAHLQQSGKLHFHNIQQLNDSNPAVVSSQSIVADYSPQTVAAVSQVTPVAESFTKAPLQLPPHWSVAEVRVKGSLAHAAYQSGLTHAELIGLNQIFNDKVNFKHLLAGDRFKVITERIPSTSQEKKATDKIIAAEFISGHTAYTAIRYKNSKTQQVNYYQTNGVGLTAGFLRYPTHYRRIGSSFLLHRLDPVTGAYHSHPGVDFDAPMNTPITATADGTIRYMAYEQGYGNVVKINHANQVQTLYAHMSHFASGFHAGSSVKKGEIIGFVGMSGYATGPHVHYELHFDSTPVNPLTVKLPATNMIPLNQKARFMQESKKDVEILNLM